MKPASSDRRVWLANAITLLACAGLAALGLRDTPVALPPPTAQTPLPTLSRPAVESQALLAQPLFNAARKPAPQAPLAPAAAAASVEPPLLIGMVMDDASPAALLENGASGERKLVHIGQVFSGWKLVAVGHKKITLTVGERRIVIPLSYEKRNANTPASEGPISP